MKFWDSSAIVPLIVDEAQTDYCLGVLSQDQEMMVWCLSVVEVLSALCRRFREGAMRDQNFRNAKVRLNTIMERTYQVRSVDKVKARALRLLEVHSLRAADACQVASALVATQEDPTRVSVISFDQRIKQAATREGFDVDPKPKNQT